MTSEKIKKLREEAGLSQSELAAKVGIKRESVYAWETSQNMPTTAHILKLSQLFKVTPNYLLDYEDADQIDISRYTSAQKRVLYTMMEYFDGIHDSKDKNDK